MTGIREYAPADFERMKELHEKCGFDYELPPLENMVVKRVLEDEHGVQMAAFLRLTSEAYLLADPRWRTPAWRWEALKKLHADVRFWAREKNLEDVNCWPPAKIEKQFGKRLLSLGWTKPVWPCYTVKV